MADFQVRHQPRYEPMQQKAWTQKFCLGEAQQDWRNFAWAQWGRRNVMEDWGTKNKYNNSNSSGNTSSNIKSSTSRHYFAHPRWRSDTSTSSSKGSINVNSIDQVDCKSTYARQPATSKTQTNASAGSSLHHLGACKPCAWYWKPQGCLNGLECGYCHLCTSDEMKSRKRAKVIMMRRGRAKRNFQAQIEELGDRVSSPGSDASTFEEGNGHKQQIEGTSASMDVITGAQQRLTIKNTFIHVEFSDQPEASRFSVLDHHVESAGIVFIAEVIYQ